MNPTLISLLLQQVESWRKSQGMSRQTASAIIVEAHERIGGPATTGIEFNPPTRDAYKRMAVNCDRIYRWLDDATKETNHLPANMLLSILSALPVSDRVFVLNQYLRPIGLVVRESMGGDEAEMLLDHTHLQVMIIESANAAADFTQLLDGATHAELVQAQQSLGRAKAEITENLLAVEALLRNRSASL